MTQQPDATIKTTTPETLSTPAPEMIKSLPPLVKEETDVPKKYHFNCSKANCVFQGLVLDSPLNEPNRCPCTWGNFRFDGKDSVCVAKHLEKVEATCKNVLMQQTLLETVTSVITDDIKKDEYRLSYMQTHSILLSCREIPKYAYRVTELSKKPAATIEKRQESATDKKRKEFYEGLLLCILMVILGFVLTNQLNAALEKNAMLEHQLNETLIQNEALELEVRNLKEELKKFQQEKDNVFCIPTFDEKANTFGCEYHIVQVDNDKLAFTSCTSDDIAVNINSYERIPEHVSTDKYSFVTTLTLITCIALMTTLFLLFLKVIKFWLGLSYEIFKMLFLDTKREIK